MSKYKHCFIIENGKYVEVSYQSLMVDGKKSPIYEDRYFIPLHGCLMEVSQKEHKEFYRVQRRQKYLLEEAILHNEMSYHALDTDELNGEETVEDVVASATDELVVKKIMIETMQEALKLLTGEELQLIQALFFDELSEREYAAKIQLTQRGVNKRKQKTLAKLKKFMKI